MSELYNDSYLKKSTEFINFIKQKSYDLLPMHSGSNILEIGCGNGHDAIEIAMRLGSSGRVVGLDIDNDLIEVSRKNALDRICDNVEFIISDAEKIPFENDYFNSVRVERVFQHLKNPAIVFDDSIRVLKKGGIFVLIETDWYGMDLYLGDSGLERKLNDILVKNVLANGMASREILYYYKKAGLQDIQFEVFPVHIKDYSIADQLIKFNHILKIGKELNKIDENDINEWNQNINFLLENNCFNLTTNIILCSGFKF
jgi:ubiquinone/menaquinone biosynthesis C-methylase UbiE